MKKYLLIPALMIFGGVILHAGKTIKESVKENRDIIKRCVILSENCPCQTVRHRVIFVE